VVFFGLGYHPALRPLDYLKILAQGSFETLDFDDLLGFEPILTLICDTPNQYFEVEILCVVELPLISLLGLYSFLKGTTQYC
jgi:hypothetical protein